MSKMSIAKQRNIMSLSFTIAIFFFAVSNGTSYADVIYLKNGNRIEGIVMSRDANKVIVKVKIGTISFSSEEIDSIEESSTEERTVLEKKWEEENLKRQQAKQEAAEADKEKTQESKPAFKNRDEKIENLPEETSKVPSKINWLSYEIGMKAARNSGKPVMIDFYADWCGWCKKLEETFRDETVRSMSVKFVCIKVNADSEKDLVRRYNVRVFPTILFLDSSGNQIGNIGGYLPPADFATQMKECAR